MAPMMAHWNHESWSERAIMRAITPGRMPTAPEPSSSAIIRKRGVSLAGVWVVNNGCQAGQADP